MRRTPPALAGDLLSKGGMSNREHRLPAPLRRALRLLGALSGGAGFLFLVYMGLTWDMRAGSAGPDAAFRRVSVVRGDLRETVVATGALEPFARVVVQSEIPGIVSRVHVDDGERVEKGAPLIELNRERLEDRVAELRAALQAREALARVNLVARAEAERDKSRRDLERTRQLFDRGIVSQKALDEAQYVFDLAVIAVSDAVAESQARRAARREAAKTLQRVERDLAKAVIRSPVDGVVVRREVEVGTAVADLQNGGTVVAVLADDRKLHLLAEVDENDVAQVGVRQPAQVSIDAFPDESFPGVVRKVSSSGSNSSGVSQFQVEIELEPDPRVRVGMSADARIVVRSHGDVLLVPNTALVRSDDRVRVRRAGREPGAGELVDVEAIYSDGFQTALRSGVGEGDVVLVRSDGDGSWEP